MASECTCQSKRKLMKRKSTKKEDQKNPYAERGVDKFSALLAEIEEKKKIIYSHINPEEVSLIRFVHAHDNKLKPLVVRANSIINNTQKSVLKPLMVEEDHKPQVLIGGAGNYDVGEQAGDQEKKIELLEFDRQEKKRFKVELSSYQVFGIVIFVLLFMAVIVGYWKKYYLLKLQVTVCPRIQDE